MDLLLRVVPDRRRFLARRASTRRQGADPVVYLTEADAVHEPGSNLRHVSGSLGADSVEQGRPIRIAGCDDSRACQFEIAASRRKVENAECIERLFEV